MEYFLELFLSGVTRGSIYALIALGYTMVYGILELINFAHGEIYMIGAFTGLIAASLLTLCGLEGLSVLLLATVAAVVYSAAYGFTVEKIAYKPLRQAPRLSPLISAIGMSGTRLGKETKSDVCASSTKFCSRIDIPIALIRGARRGAARRGR